jgi:hypothetical protein
VYLTCPTCAAAVDLNDTFGPAPAAAVAPRPAVAEAPFDHAYAAWDALLDSSATQSAERPGCADEPDRQIFAPPKPGMGWKTRAVLLIIAVCAGICTFGRDKESSSSRGGGGSYAECDRAAARTARSCCSQCGASWSGSCNFADQQQANCLAACIRDSPEPAACRGR